MAIYSLLPYGCPSHLFRHLFMKLILKSVFNAMFCVQILQSDTSKEEEEAEGDDEEEEEVLKMTDLDPIKEVTCLSIAQIFYIYTHAHFQKWCNLKKYI